MEHISQWVPYLLKLISYDTKAIVHAKEKKQTKKQNKTKKMHADAKFGCIKTVVIMAYGFL